MKSWGKILQKVRSIFKKGKEGQEVTVSQVTDPSLIHFNSIHKMYRNVTRKIQVELKSLRFLANSAVAANSLLKTHSRQILWLLSAHFESTCSVKWTLLFRYKIKINHVKKWVIFLILRTIIEENNCAQYLYIFIVMTNKIEL